MTLLEDLITLLEDLITLLGVALLEVFGQFNRNATLLEYLQIAIANFVKRFWSLLQWLESNNEMTLFRYN